VQAAGEKEDIDMSKIALVTGTSSGIGLSTAVLLAKSGFTTVATLRDPDKAGALRDRAHAEGVTVDVQRLDVLDQASVDRCVSDVLARHGKIDVLVNNAGVGKVGTLEQLSIDDLQQNMDTNFLGVARVTRAVIPSMREAKSGRIITVASLNGVVGMPFRDAYNASKFAVEGLMEGLAPVMARFGVRISIVEPGPVKTEFFASRDAKRATAADPYQALVDAYDRAFGAGTSSAAQTGDEVAKVILEAATADAPHLRYQTSPFARGVAAQVRVDPTGDSILKATGAQLG
jgi:NAD(P)-dependent dehydrogenase (short-subunit alcohol dehydrogenase family)